MDNAKVTTYLPTHTLVDVEGELPAETKIFLSEYGPYQAYSLATVDQENNLLQIIDYSPCEIDMAQMNFVDRNYPEKIIKSKEILSAHVLEGIPGNFVFFRTKYTLSGGMDYIHLYIGNSGEIGLRGGLYLEVGSQFDLNPFVNILWDLYRAYNPNYGQLSEDYLKALKDQG